MDKTYKEFCVASLVLIIVAGSLSPPHKETAAGGHNKIVARDLHDHTHRESYNYDHIQTENRISLSSTIALNDHYGDLRKKVQKAAEYQRYLKIIESE
jgi:hypothetical protein